MTSEAVKAIGYFGPARVVFALLDKTDDGSISLDERLTWIQIELINGLAPGCRRPRDEGFCSVGAMDVAGRGQVGCEESRAEAGAIIFSLPPLGVRAKGRKERAQDEGCVGRSWLALKRGGVLMFFGRFCFLSVVGCCRL